eukprot:277720-Rhodomonas_salina.1
MSSFALTMQKSSLRLVSSGEVPDRVIKSRAVHITVKTRPAGTYATAACGGGVCWGLHGLHFFYILLSRLVGCVL